jgi:cation transport regulator
MPYATDSELPASVKNHLPEHAQHIYRKALNNAYEEYKDPKKRRDPSEDPEVVAHQVAWAAVKKEYHKEGDKWVRNREESARKGS